MALEPEWPAKTVEEFWLQEGLEEDTNLPFQTRLRRSKQSFLIRNKKSGCGYIDSASRLLFL